MEKKLPDIQHSEYPEFKIYINQVGVEKVKVPFKIESRYGGFREMVANVTMTTDLDANIKGISMSMLLRTLKNYLDQPLKHQLIRKILEEFKTAVETNSKESNMKFEFELPIWKKSPKTSHVFPQYYQCSFEGKLKGDTFRFFEKVIVQYGAYCPCSSSLCNNLKEEGLSGFPHAQRAFCSLYIEVIPPQIIWLEDIIDLIERSVKNNVYPILQRVDEQEVARIASENPQFVEDAARRIANELNKESNIFDWIFKCVHQENIHTSNAICIMFKGLQNGFNGTYFL